MTRRPLEPRGGVPQPVAAAARVDDFITKSSEASTHIPTKQAELRRRIGESEDHLSAEDRSIRVRAHEIATDLRKRVYHGDTGRRTLVMVQSVLRRELQREGLTYEVYDSMVDVVATDTSHMSEADRRMREICEPIVQRIDRMVRFQVAEARLELHQEDTDSGIMSFAIDHATAEHKAAQARVEEMARDPLTGLIKDPNYFAKMFEIQRERLRKSEDDTSLIVVEMDLDDFKGENDHNPDHHTGVDRDIVMPLANEFKAKFREFDVLARMGGDEFTFILNGVKAGDVATVASKIQAMVNSVKRWNGQPLTTSIGYYVMEKKNADAVLTAEQARSLADNAAMYAKEHGGNQAVQHREGLELGPPTFDRVRRKVIKSLYRSFSRVNFEGDADVDILKPVVDKALAEELAAYTAAHPAPEAAPAT